MHDKMYDKMKKIPPKEVDTFDNREGGDGKRWDKSEDPVKLRICF